MNIDLSRNVLRCYPGAKVLGVSEAYVPGTAWTSLLPDGKMIDRSDLSPEVQIERCARMGATSVQLRLLYDGVEANPDFKISEIIDGV